MMLTRRGAARGIALAPILLAGSARAGESSATNVIVYCDPAPRRTMEGVGRVFTAQTGARVNVFCAAPWMMLAQIEHISQNDVLISGTAALDEAAERKLIKAESRIPLGHDRLVLAARIGAASTPRTGNDAIRALIGVGPLAVPDATSLTTIDAAGALAGIGLSPPYDFRTQGAADEADVAFLVASGAASLGLLYRTAARADPRLTEAAVLPDGATGDYEAAISVITRRPNATWFMDFLRTKEARARLSAAGLA
ncbi:MAG: substrate-binding domain-containing protein [Acetobacteraceae bacterium]